MTTKTAPVGVGIIGAGVISGTYIENLKSFADVELLAIADIIPEIAAAKAAEWGLVNSVVPRDALDAEVDRLVENLAAKLPQTVRYTKQQLNFWRDLSWHETVNHARDWLALSMATDEPREAVERFLSRKKDDD